MSSALQNGPQQTTGNSLSPSSSSDGMYKPTLPSWMSTDPSSQTRQLQDSFNGIDAAYNPSATVATLQKQSSGAIDTANRASSNAATEYAYRDMLSGGNAGGAGSMKAQLQLQGLDKANQYETQAAQTSDKARQDAMSAKLGAANQIAGIQTSYLGTLASFYSNMQQNMAQQAQIASTAANTKLQTDAAARNALLQSQVTLATNAGNPQRANAANFVAGLAGYGTTPGTSFNSSSYFQ